CSVCFNNCSICLSFQTNIFLTFQLLRILSGSLPHSMPVRNILWKTPGFLRHISPEAARYILLSWRFLSSPASLLLLLLTPWSIHVLSDKRDTTLQEGTSRQFPDGTPCPVLPSYPRR